VRTLSDEARASIDQALRGAEQRLRLEISVFIGPPQGHSRGYAERLHSAMLVPSRSILVMVDPAARAVEVVTGADARQLVPDHSLREWVRASLPVLADDLTAGLVELMRELRPPDAAPRQAVPAA
jgi:hypothetical protein